MNSGTTNGDLVAASQRCAPRPARRRSSSTRSRTARARAEVEAGRADFGVEDYPSAADLVAASNGKTALAGKPLQPSPYGFGIAKDRTALRDAVQRALQESIASGRYAEVLKAHGVEAAALTTTALNGGA